ncbi:hypothetical protein GF358_03210, partial [Candidatus Woesearchaeota archaeon]|nr:hypothetical protein [Candidatus Woesearchaeota archaeon]
AGNIYIADRANRRISKWNSAGSAIGWIGGGSNGWKTTSGAAAGSDYQSFNFGGIIDSCAGVFVDTSGNIYIADFRNDRVCKWDSSGNAIGWIGGGSNGWKTSVGASAGRDYQSFDHPTTVCLDSLGNIYIANYARISKWNSAGNAIGWIGDGSNGWKINDITPSLNSDYQSFASPRGIFVNSSGTIFIADTLNHRISKWQD